MLEDEKVVAGISVNLHGLTNKVDTKTKTGGRKIIQNTLNNVKFYLNNIRSCTNLLEFSNLHSTLKLQETKINENWRAMMNKIKHQKMCVIRG